MSDKKIKKQTVDKIGRVFTMLFNRAVMYDMKHPFTIQSMGDFHRLMKDELEKYTPIVLIMHQEKFFIEDEPLDSRINVSKILAHFKKSDIQSIQFEKGFSREELEQFFNTIIDTLSFPNSEAMLRELSTHRIDKLKLNHVFFQKVTVDDTVVEKDSVKSIAEGRAADRKKRLKSEILDILTGGLAIEELGKSLSVTDFLAEPENAAAGVLEQSGNTGPMLLDNLAKIKSEVDKASEGAQGSKLHHLAESVVQMKSDLLNGIAQKKRAGLSFANEEKLLVETNELADNVILKLVKDEYQQGATSVKRLAQILRRLIPDNEELQRLLPKLKETLLIEGMSLDDFLELTGEIEKEIANKDISDAIKKSAEDIGVSGEELLREITTNPSEAAELIYLASELRKETGDKKALTDVLVEYIERVGAKIALDSPNVQGESKDHLKEVIQGVESEIVSKLKGKEIEANVLESVVERLDERMDTFISKLEKSMDQRESVFGTWDHETTSLLKIFEENVRDSEELKVVLKQIHQKVVDQKTGEIDTSALEKELNDTGEVDAGKDEEGKESSFSLPKGVLSRKNILYFLEREIARSSRYQVPFSAVTFSILKAIPQKKFAAGTVKHDDITASVLKELVAQVRDTDLVGVLDRKKIISLLPMTDEEMAKLAMRRLLKRVHSQLFKVNDVPIEVKFGASVTSYIKKDTPDLKAFIRRAERDITEVVQRLKNLQTLY